MDVYLSTHWNPLLEEFADDQKDIYFYEEYVKLYEDAASKAFCVVCKEGNSIVLMPFLRRAINDYFDFETAYGYGGPISNTDDEAWIHKAIAAISEYLLAQKYICGFVRFHPLLRNAAHCGGCFDVLFDRTTVCINTETTAEEIWTEQITSKNRNMIRKAEKNGLVYQAEYDFGSLKEFIALYNATMERLRAEKFYFFDDSYYEEFVRQFTGKAFLGTVRKDDRLICAALFMYSKNYGHYHLEGSDHACSGLGANNLLLWKTASEFHSHDVKEFHLGGGYDSSEDNSLLKFKKAFSHNYRDFYIGKWIFNREKYTEIKDAWSKRSPEKEKQYGKLLLCYRY